MTFASGKRPIRHVRAARSRRSKLPPAADLIFLAPAVIALRWPVLWWEMATPFFASRRDGAEASRVVIEKTAAIAESYGVAQAQMALATTRLWIGAMAGERPDAAVLSRSFSDIFDVSAEPHARRVRANYRRLRRIARQR